jgi:5-methylcytosine-specific restriction endonuclease McrA
MGSKISEAERLQIIELYKEKGTYKKVMEVVGRSPTTIWKIITAAGLGKGMGGNQTSQMKITDKQLIEESNYLNCVEIARKYEMSAERVYRRARKLGLNVDCVGGGGHYRRRQDNYGSMDYDGSVTLKRVRQKYSDICQICGKPVDDTDIEHGHIKRLYPTIDHIIPLSKGGSHTWSNVQLAHMSCNAGKCDKVNNTV